MVCIHNGISHGLKNLSIFRSSDGPRGCCAETQDGKNDRRANAFSSVAQSCPTLCDPMNRTQHARPPCPSPAAGVHSDSHPSSPWCHPAIASWVVPFSSCPQSLPASGSFPMSPLFAWSGQSTGASALASSWSLISEIQERKQMNKNSNTEAEL